MIHAIREGFSLFSHMRRNLGSSMCHRRLFDVVKGFVSDEEQERGVEEKVRRKEKDRQKNTNERSKNGKKGSEGERE
jgi:hypothetical protein